MERYLHTKLLANPSRNRRPENELAGECSPKA
jgi:hypothetical protein